MDEKDLLHPLSAWENSRGFFAALRALSVLCRAVLFRPVEFFQELSLCVNVDVQKRVRRAVLCALLFGFLKLFLDTANIFWMRALPKTAVASFFEAQFTMVSASVVGSPFFLLRPVIAFVLAFVLLAAGVKLIVGVDKPLLPLFLVVCYKSVADVFYIIPFIGGFVALVWSMALLVVGVKEAYKITPGRAVVVAIVMPAIMTFFLLLAIAPSVGRIMMVLYPEAKTQIVKINDLSAYVTTSAIVSATQVYRKELGFYPAHLGVLKKYLAGDLIDIATSPEAEGGYRYRYERLDDQHFMLEATPRKPGASGRFVFYVNESGKVRLGGPDGRWVENLDQLQAIVPSEEELKE